MKWILGILIGMGLYYSWTHKEQWLASALSHQLGLPVSIASLSFEGTSLILTDLSISVPEEQLILELHHTQISPVWSSLFQRTLHLHSWESHHGLLRTLVVPPQALPTLSSRLLSLRIDHCALHEIFRDTVANQKHRQRIPIPPYDEYDVGSSDPLSFRSLLQEWLDAFSSSPVYRKKQSIWTFAPPTDHIQQTLRHPLFTVHTPKHTQEGSLSMYCSLDSGI